VHKLGRVPIPPDLQEDRIIAPHALPDSGIDPEVELARRAGENAHAGGIIDRVVRLNNGEYEVHNFAVNWPHHIFVSKNF